MKRVSTNGRVVSKRSNIAARTIQMAHRRRMNQPLINNQVTFNEYPRRRKISFDKKNFNARGLLIAMTHNDWKVPHSRRNYTNDEISEIIARVVEPGFKSTVKYVIKKLILKKPNSKSNRAVSTPFNFSYSSHLDPQNYLVE
jgi:hypothetical protein